MQWLLVHQMRTHAFMLQFIPRNTCAYYLKAPLCCTSLLPSVGNKYRFRVLEEHAFRVNLKAGAICIDFGVLLVSTWALFL